MKKTLLFLASAILVCSACSRAEGPTILNLTSNTLFVQVTYAGGRTDRVSIKPYQTLGFNQPIVEKDLGALQKVVIRRGSDGSQEDVTPMIRSVTPVKDALVVVYESKTEVMTEKEARKRHLGISGRHAPP